MNLDTRLSAIASLIPSNTVVADIGTDHAYLPIFLVTKGHTPMVIAGEVNAGPFHSAQESIEKLHLSERIILRLGDGLSILKPGEADTVVIAGMGGGTIVDILEAQPKVVAAIRHFVVQPMVAGPLVRLWFVRNGWTIVDEEIVVDEDKIYEIIRADKGVSSAEWDMTDLEIGPILWQKKHPALEIHLTRLIAKTKKILSEMSVSEEAKLTDKYRELQQKRLQLEERLRCL